MAKERARSYPISPFRRLVTDLMEFSRAVPAVTIERRMDLAAVAAARRRCANRPSWAVVFAKAFALTARSHRELRRSYLSFPTARFYEHPYSVAAINVERQAADESVVLQCLIRRPENRSLTELDGIVRQHQDKPIEQLRCYRRSMTLSNLPWPIRYFVWQMSLNAFGRRRSHNFGTFGLSTVAALGSNLLHVIPVLTSMLHYGLIDEDGRLEMRMTWDHRVMDGAVAARILGAVERTLRDDVLAELIHMRGAAAA